MLSSMLEILKQVVGEGQFCQRVHWVYLQNSFTCAQLYAEDSQAKGGCGSVLSASTLGVSASSFTCAWALPPRFLPSAEIATMASS
jgi:hypothetical protein